MRMRGDERVVLAERVRAMARPAVRRRVRGEPGAHRILLDVAHAREHLRPRVYGRGVVGFLPYRSLVAVLEREIAGVARGNRGHQARRPPLALRGEEEVHVVSHQGVGVDRAAGPRGAFAQHPEIGGAVSAAGKARAALVTALDHVKRTVSFFGTSEAHHGQTTSPGAAPLTISADDPLVD